MAKIIECMLHHKLFERCINHSPLKMKSLFVQIKQKYNIYLRRIVLVVNSKVVCYFHPTRIVLIVSCRVVCYFHPTRIVQVVSCKAVLFPFYKGYASYKLQRLCYLQSCVLFPYYKGTRALQVKSCKM